MRAFGKKRHHWNECYLAGHLTSRDGGKSWAVFRTFTPFDRRRHKKLTTSKAHARRQDRVACETGKMDYVLV